LKEMKNENQKRRKTPVVTFEDFLKHETGECKMKGPFIVREEDTEKLMEYLKTNRPILGIHRNKVLIR